MVTQSPDFFNRGPSHHVRLLFFCALAIAVMVVDARFRYMPAVRTGVATVAHPLQEAALTPGRLVKRVTDFFVTQSSLQQQNEKLRQEVLSQSQQLQQLRLLEAEVDNLRRILDARKRVTETSQLVEIIHTGRNPFNRRVVVDKGSRDNIEAGLAVIDAEGVVGQVTRVFPFTSEITLLTDKNQAIPVMVSRNGLRAVVFGNGQESTLNLPYIPANADVQNGDLLVTSGIDGTYPAGLAVAKVSNIERNATYVFAKITCTPLARVDYDRHVLVLSNLARDARPAVEPGILEPKPEPRRGNATPRRKTR
jgi:rod shape-determining protein MreC